MSINKNSVGNWRNHIIVKCVCCKKPMAYHIVSVTAKCVECELKEQEL